MRSIVCILALALIAMPFVASATEPPPTDTGSATAKVHCQVNPYMAVQATTVEVDAGTVTMGEFSADITFQVDANTQFVLITVEGSDLYKGNTVGPDAPVIPLMESAGCYIDPLDGAPVPGEMNPAPAQGPGSDIPDPNGGSPFPTELFKTTKCEANTPGHFSMPVKITLMYDQDELEKPTGVYSGYVRLTAVTAVL